MFPPIAHLAFISDGSFDNLQATCTWLTATPWREVERVEGRQVHVGQLATDWPHFKAYFEQLGWEVAAVNVAPHSGYVEHATFRPRTAA